MPVITISLVPPSINKEILKKLCLDIFAAVASISELRLTTDDTTVLLPQDILEWGIGTVLIVQIHGLLKKPERTKAVRDRLLEAVGIVVADFARTNVSQCKKIEVIPCDYDQDRDGSCVIQLQD